MTSCMTWDGYRISQLNLPTNVLPGGEVPDSFFLTGYPDARQKLHGPVTFYGEPVQVVGVTASNKATLASALIILHQYNKDCATFLKDVTELGLLRSSFDFSAILVTTRSVYGITVTPKKVFFTAQQRSNKVAVGSSAGAAGIFMGYGTPGDVAVASYLLECPDFSQAQIRSAIPLLGKPPREGSLKIASIDSLVAMLGITTGPGNNPTVVMQAALIDEARS